MRRARVKGEGDAFYHIMSRCALQQFLLTDDVKEMFLKILRRAEFFSGVKIINYCVMDNHFHLLLKVPKRREVSDDELLGRIRVLYGETKAKNILTRWEVLHKAGNDSLIQRERDAFRKRMYDISEFMKTFKQRFSLWYCTNHGNIEGTIWQGPFHSVLVEGKHDALSAISTYITLNPVRAKMVDDPGDYAWSGYGAACTGDVAAKRALLSTYQANGHVAEKWNAYVSMLEVAMAESGPLEEKSADDIGKAEKNDEAAKPVKDVRFGKITKSQLVIKVMHYKERDVSRGVAFGSKKFVDGAIKGASREGEIRTVSKAYCIGEQKTQLYCAGRRRA